MGRPLAVSKHKLAAVVLAAGASTRLGRPKQLLRRRSVPLIVEAVRLARAAVGPEVVVVIGSESQRMRSVLRRHTPGVTIVNNSRWPEGIASSVRAGARSLAADTAGVLYLLVDQVEIGATELAALVETWTSQPGIPAAARYSGRAGVPAIIPRRRFRDIGDLTGDIGARQLLRGLGKINCVDMPAGEADLDTPEDAARLGY